MASFTPNPARPASWDQPYSWPPTDDRSVACAVAEEAEQILFTSYGYNTEDLDLEPLAAAQLGWMASEAECPEATAAAYGPSDEANGLRHSMALRIASGIAQAVVGPDLPPLQWHPAASVETVGYTLQVEQGLVPYGTGGPVAWRVLAVAPVVGPQPQVRSCHSSLRMALAWCAQQVEAEVAAEQA